VRDDDSDTSRKTARKKVVPRRSALKTSFKIAGGVVGLAAAGGGMRLWQTGAGGNLTGGPAFDPWREWEAGTLKGHDGIITAAILASNPHNSQPWKFAVTDNIIDLFADTSRSLGTLDPIGREMMMGLGCAVENMVIGAPAVGYTAILNLFPAGTASDHIARLTVFNGERDRPLESTVLAQRHTHRGPYLREKTVPNEVVDSLYAQTKLGKARVVWLGAETNNGRAFAQGTLEAAQALVADTDMNRDSHAWLRHDLATINEKRDGLTTTTAGLSPFLTRLALTAPAQMIKDRADDQWITSLRDVQLATAPMFGLITVPDLADRTALVEAGRLWQRLHLTGTLKGLAMQPLNQMMEIADRDRALQRPSKTAETLTELAGFADSVVAFGFRLGYAEQPAPPSPRRSAKQVLAV